MIFYIMTLKGPRNFRGPFFFVVSIRRGELRSPPRTCDLHLICQPSAATRRFALQNSVVACDLVLPPEKALDSRGREVPTRCGESLSISRKKN